MSTLVDSHDFERAAEALERRGFERQAGRTTAWAAKRGANVIRRNVRAAARPHRKTGRLSGNVRVSYHGQGLGFEATVRAGGMVAPIIAHGQRAHEIAPRNAKALTITAAKGRAVIAFSGPVQHPGTRPDPFFAEGVDASKGEIQSIANASAETMAKELAHRIGGRS